MSHESCDEWPYSSQVAKILRCQPRNDTDDTDGEEMRLLFVLSVPSVVCLSGLRVPRARPTKAIPRPMIATQVRNTRMKMSGRSICCMSTSDGSYIVLPSTTAVGTACI